MIPRHALSITSFMLLASVTAPSLAQTEKKSSLADFLVDIGAAPVSAGSITGLNASAITSVQTAQDMILAINPFNNNDSRSGYGLAITPARTSITPMSGSTYFSSSAMRVLGSTTLSYAENKATIGSSSFQKLAYSLDASLYLNVDDDPVKYMYDAFLGCEQRKKHQDEAKDAAVQGKSDEFKRLMELATKADKECKAGAAKAKAKWNASRISLSYAKGDIKPASGGGRKESLGKFLTVSATIGIGDSVAALASYRRARDAVDTGTLATTPVFKSSSIAALRVTTNPAGKDDLRWLAEVSNAKASSTTAAETINFKHAVGIDKKLFEGLWLEFRIGRGRKSSGTENETKSLLSINWAPSSTLFAK
ncbi:MAG: hypothetical protein SF172_04660 [Burkholderiales bacterium]|nr:hypothetical protein [Burkholderiales bacterium]